MRMLMLLIAASLITSEVLADEQTWALLSVAQAESGREALVRAGLSDTGAIAVAEYAKSAAGKLEKEQAAARREICENAEFYAGAPEHLADAIDRAADAYEAARHAIGEAVYEKVDRIDGEKLRALASKNDVHIVKPERYGDSVRYGKKNAAEAVAALCNHE
jgi:hypothetical protein